MDHFRSDRRDTAGLVPSRRAVTLALLFIGVLSAAETPKLGHFSLSLAVKDLPVSRAFYEKLGFTVYKFDGPTLPKYGETWIILQNGTATIGLFQGAFDKNTLTFHPTDVRSLQRSLKQSGIKFKIEADETSKGPASAFLMDPDGNPILLDQITP